MGKDTTKARLEELAADEDELKKLVNLSQQDYVNHIDTLNSELVRGSLFGFGVFFFPLLLFFWCCC